MHVAIVSPEFPPDIGGVETYALEYAQELARRSHEVTVFTVRHPKGEVSLPGVRIEPVLRLSRAADRRIFASFRADVWHPLNAGYAWIANERPNGLVTVHGNDFLRPYVPLVQPDLRDVPFLWRWSDAVSGRYRGLWNRLSAGAVRRALADARHIIANSHYTERVLVERIPRCRGRTSVAFVGVGAHFFDVVRQSAADGVPRLLTVSRLSEARKNVDRVLHALARLRKRHAFRYTIVGDGHDRPRLQRLADELHLGDRVRFTGFVSVDELMRIYAHSDLMVLASSINPGSHEGFGIVYLEAAASGVPSLAARLAGAAEAIDDERSGMYVDEPTVDALAGALGAFLEGRVRFEPEACRDFARRFTWAKVVDHCVQYYGTNDDARRLSDAHDAASAIGYKGRSTERRETRA
jgi:phosphatidylinositol alpha-1,6-mannosyltransferase